MIIYADRYNPIETIIGKMVEYITPFVNMVLYICSVNADFGDTGRPQHPANIPRRKGKFPTAQQPRIWDIGVRIGPALKRALKPTENPSAGRENPRTPPRPHYRRAHWHNFWTGPRNQPDERKLILKWLPPIPVGIQDFDDDSENPRPAVIHPIRAE